MSFDYCYICGNGLVEVEEDVYECEFCETRLDLSVFETTEELEEVDEYDGE